MAYHINIFIESLLILLKFFVIAICVSKINKPQGQNMLFFIPAILNFNNHSNLVLTKSFSKTKIISVSTKNNCETQLFHIVFFAKMTKVLEIFTMIHH